VTLTVTRRTPSHIAGVLGLAAALVIFGNAKAWWDLVVLQSTAAGSTFAIGAGIALVLVILGVAVLIRTDLCGLGVAGGRLRPSLGLGFSIGGTAALAGGAVILGGALAARRLGVQLADVTPAASVPWGPLLWRAVLLLWVDTVIPEELAFRGALLLTLDGSGTSNAPVCPAGFRGTWLAVGRAAMRPAVLISSAVFAAWHVVVVLQDGPPDVLTVTGKLLVIAVGGLLFGGLRLVGGNLLAPIVGHWLFDLVAMIAARLAVAL
jgi:membrane protease YdiL (CAAX protease family)